MKLQHEEQARVHAADRLAMDEVKAVADKVNLLTTHSPTVLLPVFVYDLTFLLSYFCVFTGV